jgi:hypothetical protein
MKWALDVVAFHKTLAQFGVAMATHIVDSENTIVYFKNGNVLVLWCDRNPCTFKQICLGGNVNPLAHD